jgi:dTDP-4-dehydrorhamnose reductase
VRILVTGATGQLGAAVVAALEGHEVLAPTRAELDLTEAAQVEQVVAAHAPEAVINAAAFTDVDGCERDPEQALAVNASGVRSLAVAATRVDAHVLHVSTDYVFDGRAERPYDEWAPARPLSEYGRSKLAGERELAAHASYWTAVRTSWVFGGRGADLVSWAFAAHDRGELTGVLADQVSVPTYAPDLAELLVGLAVARHRGLFHATSGAEAVTRHEWIASALRLRGVDLSGLAALDAADLDRPAARPSFSALDNRALRLGGLPLLRPWRQALAAYVATWDG